MCTVWVFLYQVGIQPVRDFPCKLNTVDSEYQKSFFNQVQVSCPLSSNNMLTWKMFIVEKIG